MICFEVCHEREMFSQLIIGRFEAVIHFAGLKAVGESVSKPLRYYSNNLISTINLMEVMSKNNCKNVSKLFLVFWEASVDRHCITFLLRCSWSLKR